MIAIWRDYKEANFDIDLPPGKESPGGFNLSRCIQGYGNYFAFPADSDEGRAYAHYKDGEDALDLANRLYEKGVFDPYFPTDERDALFDYCLEVSFQLCESLERIIDEVKYRWRL